MKPMFVKEENHIFKSEYHPDVIADKNEGTKAIYHVKGNKVYASAAHTDGPSAHALFTIGETGLIHTTLDHPETVTELACEMAKYKITWLEEPMPPDDHESYRALCAQKIVPVATGEHEQEEDGFYDLIDTGAADYIQADVCCQGGFAMGQRIFARVQEKKLRFAFHSWGTALEVLAAAHLGICWPANVVEWLEYPIYTKSGCPVMYPWPLAEEILREPFDILSGELIVPKDSGLGIEVDERVIEKYPFIPGPWSFFRIDSPLETVAVTGDHSVKWVSADNKSPA